jgi:hypothetical protein
MSATEKGSASTFREIFAYVDSHVRRPGKKLTEREALLSAGDWWSGRYPRFDLWACGEDGCAELSLGTPRCFLHGGASLFRITDADVLEFFVGGVWRMYSAVVTGAESHEVVEHLDGNPWNCHPMNMVVRPHRFRRYRRWSSESPVELARSDEELAQACDAGVVAE